LRPVEGLDYRARHPWMQRWAQAPVVAKQLSQTKTSRLGVQEKQNVSMGPRLHVEEMKLDVSGAAFALDEGPSRHVQVLRMQPGEGLRVFDGRGREWQAEVTEMGRKVVQVRVLHGIDNDRELPVRVTLAVGMTANDRMDTLVEKATELGAHAIQPLLCARSVLRLDGERAAKKVAHWQAVAVATVGNTLGGITSYLLGRLIPNRAQHKAIIYLHKYGYWALLFSWVPLFGDALCVAAGWLRFNPWVSMLLFAVGKLFRYVLVAGGWTWIERVVLPMFGVSL